MSNEMQAPDAGITGGSIPEFMQVALQHKLMLGTGLICGLVVGYLAYLKLGPTYQATARVLVSKRNAAPLRTQPQDEVSAAVGERAEHVTLIMSPMIVGEAVRKHKLNELRTLSRVHDVVDEILDGLHVKRTAGTDRSLINVLDISYECPDGKDAVRVVKAVVEAYKDYLDSSHKEYTAEMLSLIDDANRDLLNQLKAKEQAYIEFRKSAPLQWRNAPGTEGNPSDTTNIHQERVIAIDQERRTNLVKRTEVQARLESIEEAIRRKEPRETVELLARRLQYLDGTSAAYQPQIARAEDRRALASMEARLLPLLLEEKKLLRDYGDDHPDVRSVRKSIEVTREFYRRQGFELPDVESPQAKEQVVATSIAPSIDIVKAYPDSLRKQLKEIDYREQQLSRMFETEMKLAKDFSKYQLEDRKLNSELKRLQTLWDAVVNRLSQVNLTKEREVGGYTLKVMSPPTCNVVTKRKLKFIGGGGGLGGVLAFVIGFFLLWRDNTFKTVAELQHALRTTLLGRVPTLDLASCEAAARESKLSPALYYYHKPASAEAEAYRSVRSALLVATHASGEKVIQVTSAEPQDGKTTLIANLAVALAQSGKRVLLIDADMRCPKQHTMFNLRPEIGLSDVLNGDIELLNAVQQTVISRLSALSAGNAPANPAELLSSPAMKRVLAQARLEYDMVLVDTPPLLAVSDPCVVSAYTDGLLLVVRLQKNSRDAVLRAQEILRTHGTKVLGVVANGVPANDRYGDTYGYSGGSDYYKDARTETPDPVAVSN